MTPKDPITWGHEFSAIVTEVHSSVTHLRPSSRVAIEPIGPDGTCAYCLAGRPNQCDNLVIYGLTTSGGMVTSLVLPATTCHELPANVGLDLGALVEPLAVAWNGVLASGVKKGETALVIGTGSIGVATVLCLQAFGVERIVVTGRNEGRNALLKGWGLEGVLDSSKEDVAKKTKEIFDG